MYPGRISARWRSKGGKGRTPGRCAPTTPPRKAPRRHGVQEGGCEDGPAYLTADDLADARSSSRFARQVRRNRCAVAVSRLRRSFLMMVLMKKEWKYVIGPNVMTLRVVHVRAAILGSSPALQTRKTVGTRRSWSPSVSWTGPRPALDFLVDAFFDLLGARTLTDALARAASCARNVEDHEELEG